MDRSQLIGTLLIALLLGGYFFYFGQSKETEVKTHLKQEISKEAIKADGRIVENNAYANTPDSLLSEKMGVFASALKGEAKTVRLENEDLVITLSSKGGSIQTVEIKKYKNYDGGKLILLDEKSSNIEQALNTKYGKVLINDLFFQVVSSDARSVSFKAALQGDNFIQFDYSLDENGFLLSQKANVNVAKEFINEPFIALTWNNRLKRLETDLEQCRIRATVNYYDKKGDFDYLSETSQTLEEVQVQEPLHWFAMKDRFFTSAIITDDVMQKAYFSSEGDKNDTTSAKYLRAMVSLPIATLDKAANLRYFFGPNDFDIVNNVTDGFDKNVYLGWPVIAPFTRWVIIPLFNLFEKASTNYGLVIILMVFFVRMVMFPLTYKAYLSQAKMKALQPELAILKEKYADDMTRMSQEQMKLYGQVGINPLSGCIPVLLQMPVFLSLFTFFPNAIQLRGQSFLWAHDLSTYDSILQLPFEIPFWGSHLSLFTVLMAVSQIGITSYTMQSQTQPANSPINMKAMMYMMPIMFMFMLNSYPAGLTMYYFVSNMITLGQNAAIRLFFVDDAKILAILEKNREKNAANPPKKSSFRQRLEDTMKAQQDAKENKEPKDKKDDKDKKPPKDTKK